MRMWMPCLLLLTELEAQMSINWKVDKWWYIHTIGYHSAGSCWGIQSQDTLERIRPNPEVTWMPLILEKAKL